VRRFSRENFQRVLWDTSFRTSEGLAAKRTCPHHHCTDIEVSVGRADGERAVNVKYTFDIPDRKQTHFLAIALRGPAFEVIRRGESCGWLPQNRGTKSFMGYLSFKSIENWEGVPSIELQMAWPHGPTAWTLCIIPDLLPRIVHSRKGGEGAKPRIRVTYDDVPEAVIGGIPMPDQSGWAQAFVAPSAVRLRDAEDLGILMTPAFAAEATLDLRREISENLVSIVSWLRTSLGGCGPREILLAIPEECRRYLAWSNGSCVGISPYAFVGPDDNPTSPATHSIAMQVASTWWPASRSAYGPGSGALQAGLASGLGLLCAQALGNRDNVMRMFPLLQSAASNPDYPDQWYWKRGWMSQRETSQLALEIYDRWRDAGVVPAEVKALTERSWGQWISANDLWSALGSPAAWMRKGV
jgi:hypothetical protein